MLAKTLVFQPRSQTASWVVPHFRPENPVVTRAAEKFHGRTGSSGLFAPFCPLAFMLSSYRSVGWLVGAVGIEPKALLTGRKLLTRLTAKIAQLRYNPGTRG